ncbi:MAG TPA: hypothetical protein VM686_14770, partial [Polyangiaceae bacterium]|nr:hypothetical protein [Polyangiaceae bacterium]
MSAEYRRLKLRRKTLLAASLAVLPLFAACGDGQKEATNTAQEKVHLLSLFELEGDVTDSTTQLGEDWNTVFTGGNAIRTAGPTTDGPNHSIFTQGSKDIDDLSVWHWGEGSAPDKDELITAYAAAYVLNGDLVAYFGANRYAVDGDAQIGFWFFKNKITLVDNAKGTDDFSGVHAVGDVLILSDFTQGGTIGNIGVYKWDVVEQKGQNVIFGPKFVAGGVPAPDQNDTHVFCLEGGATDDLACATINSAPLNPTNWPTETKGVNGNDADIPPGGFFEGGLNLTDLVGGNTCFSSFMAETRSSQSITATLKDFVLSSFETCAVSIVKDCSNTVTNPPGSPKQFTSTWTATVTNSGAGGLPVGTVITVQDDNGTPSIKTDDPPAQSCKLDTIVPAGEAVEPSDGEPGAPCTFGGTIQTDVNGVTNSVSVTAQINGTTLSASDSDDCPGAPLEPP